jgi:hypothetical protein
MYLCEVLFIGQYRHQEKNNSIIASNERESRNPSRVSRSEVPGLGSAGFVNETERAVGTNCLSKFMNWCKVWRPSSNISQFHSLCIYLVTDSLLPSAEN